MTNDEPAPPQVTVHAWLDLVRSALASDADLGLGSAERRLLLDLSRLAAHASERPAAPLTTYLAGIALAGLDSAARVERLERLVADLQAAMA